MRALAITGPRARADHLQSFHLPNIEQKILELPEPAQAAAEVRASSPDLVLLFGGDGTLNRHLSWIVEAQLPVLPVPVGSGNDFAVCHGIHDLKQASEMFKNFAKSGLVKTSRTDLGRATFADRTQKYFSCCLNVGLDADAARRTNRLPDWLKEKNGYFLGGLDAALFYQPKSLKLCEMSGRVDLETPAWFVTVSNTPIFGGGLKIAPQAKIDDGKLDVTLAPSTRLSRLALLWHYPKILSGRHVEIQQLQIFTGTHLRIGSKDAGPVYGDGEYLGELPVEVSVVPQAIQVAIP